MAKHNLVIAMGLGKPKGTSDSAPPSYKSQAPAPDVGQTGTPADDPTAGMEGQDTGGITPEEVDYSDNDSCADCQNMQGDSCAKYGFPVQPSGHCEAGFEPKGGAGDMTGADMGGMGGAGTSQGVPQ